MGRRKKVILPPDLPKEVGEDEVEVSDEDFEFLRSNQEYAGFLQSLDTKAIDRHVVRVADMKEDDLEALYERRKRKNSLKEAPKEGEIRVDPVDALPVKTLDGQLYYRTAKDSKSNATPKVDEENMADENENNVSSTIVRLTKAERRQKMKKNRKEAKKQAKVEAEELAEENPHAEVLATVEKDLSAKEVFLKKKDKLAEIGISLLEDPENVKSLKELKQFYNDDDKNIVKLALLSLLAVFKDIIPGYRIRLPTETELKMKVSNPVQKMRIYESTLLNSYKAYLQRLIHLERKLFFRQVAVRCLCGLLEAAPHFNFRANLLTSIVKNISSPDDTIRKLCCSAVISVFSNEGKHGGEVTVEAVQLIANHVKINNCQLHPDSVEVFLHLKFDDDIGKSQFMKEKEKPKKKKWNKNRREPKLMQTDDRKLSKQELAAKTREEVRADLKAASFVIDPEDRRKMQTETLSAIFETYFRILKNTMELDSSRSADAGFAGADSHPLLAPCLTGLAKFSHLIDLDFMTALMGCLKKLAGCGGHQFSSSSKISLSVSERLQCCIVAFKVMRNNLDALNVDLQDFFVQLYNLLLEYRPHREQGMILAEALNIMLCEGKQHDMQRAAAFVKRLATFSLCFGSAEALAALVTLKSLLQKNSKCRNLLESDAGGGSLSGLVVKYQPDAMDPNLSGALASVLWELSLLNKHYHPTISTMASSISVMNTTQNPVYLSISTPQQAFAELSVEQEPFKLNGKSNVNRKKRKIGETGSSSLFSSLVQERENFADDDDDDGLRSKLENHFNVVREISESERLRGELNKTLASINLYEEYKNQKKRKKLTKSEKRT